MARLVGRVAQPDETAAPKTPTVDEVLEGIGVDTKALKERISGLAARFPGGIPAALLLDVLNNAVSPAALFVKIGEVYAAAQALSKTGKGPVGHSSSEVA